MCDVRVNATNPTPQNAFTFNICAFDGKKKIKKERRNIFWTSPQNFDLCFNHLSPNNAYWCSFGVISF